jgi:hypothetical protein
MANTGVSMGSRYYINNINPALLVDTKLTIFEFGFQGRTRLINSNDGNQRNYGGNFNYVSLALPISKKVTVAAGFKPFSTIRYSSSSVYNISNAPGDTSLYTTASSGSGAISQVFLSGGYEINSNWSVGASASFLFGSVSDQSSIFTGIPVTYHFTNDYTNIVVLRSTVMNGYNLQGGLAYRKYILSEKYRINVGLTASFASLFNSLNSTYLQKNAVSGGGSTYLTDTLTGNNPSIKLPSTFVIGASINKGEQWTVGTDFTFQSFSNETYRNSGSLQNAFNWSLGGEFNPIYGKNVKGYLTRIVYRAGVYAGRTQYVINGTPINDMGFTVGFGAPLGKLFSYVNLSGQFGTRGTVSNGLIQENYIKINLGLNINDRWFIRPKVD